MAWLMCQSTVTVGQLLYAQRLITGGIDTENITESMPVKYLYFGWVDKTCIHEANTKLHDTNYKYITNSRDR